jgi:hypothetical protein
MLSFPQINAAFRGRPMARKTIEKVNFRTNLILYYAAIGVIILGYVFLSIGGANSFTSLTLGPIVLVFGYLVAIPVALMIGIARKENTEEPAESPSAPAKPSRKP